MADQISGFDVSVVIPLYNHAHYIGAAIQSVLAQTHPAREIIVIDDGSKDNGVEIAREMLAGHPRATVLAQTNVGAHNTINRCIDLATSRFIAVLNSDDLFEPSKLERCAQLWVEDPQAELLFGNVRLIDDNGANVKDGPTIDWLARARDFLLRSDKLDLALANENFAVTTSNFVFTKDIWKRNGGFQALRYCHDLEFVFASLRNGHVVYDAAHDHILYRVHASNTIKEYVNRVRVEIACVLASAISGGLLMDSTAPCDARALTLFDKALLDKGLGNLVPFLTARLAALEGDRPAFYDWAITNKDMNDVLLQHVEGVLSAADFEPLSERSIYRAGMPYQASQRAELSENLDPAARRLASFHASLDSVLRSHQGTAASGSPDIPPLSGPIVVELSSFDRGGLEKVVLDTSVALRDLGLDSIIVSCGKVGHLGSIARAEGFTVYELSLEDPLGHYRQILVKHDAKLAISHFSRTGYPVFKQLGIPNITFIHNVYAFLNGDALNNFREDDVYVDRYISVSPKATDYAETRLGIDRRKIFTVPNGLLIEEHIARARAATPVTRAQFGIAEDDYVFLNVASYNLHKNHYLMADAMRMLLRKTNRVRILCIGNTIVPHHINELRNHLETIGVADHMLLPGYFPDVAPFHAIADAFLLPSLIEGWSIAMNEAMFFGKPMILSDTGGSGEVITDNDIGILLPNEYGPVSNLHSELLDDIAYNRRHFRTSAFLARAMLDFASSPEYWSQAGLKGRKRLIDNYDFVPMVRSYLPIFRDILERNAQTVKSAEVNA